MPSVPKIRPSIVAWICVPTRYWRCQRAEAANCRSDMVPMIGPAWISGGTGAFMRGSLTFQYPWGKYRRFQTALERTTGAEGRSAFGVEVSRPLSLPSALIARRDSIRDTADVSRNAAKDSSLFPDSSCDAADLSICKLSGSLCTCLPINLKYGYNR